MSTISIIGSGTMATAVAGRIAKAGHTVEMVNRNAAKAQKLASKLGACGHGDVWGCAGGRHRHTRRALWQRGRGGGRF